MAVLAMAADTTTLALLEIRLVGTGSIYTGPSSMLIIMVANRDASCQCADYR